MLNTETVLKLIDKGFTHDEIMAMETGEPIKEEPKTETEPPKTETEPPKTETEPSKTETEPKQEVTGTDILNAILSLGKTIQTGQAQGARMPAIEELTGEDVLASIIRPTKKGD